jgi:predicted acetyltransferase
MKITLPKEGVISTRFETEKPEISSVSSDHNIPTEAKNISSFPPSKKMLGFVLKAEENRNVNKDQPSTDCSKSEQQDDTLTTKVDEEEDERLWRPSCNGYFESHDRLWAPATYESVVDSTTSRSSGASMSYDAWLEKKRQSAKETKTERPSSASAMKSKVGREMDVTAFKQWLESKKKFRKRSESESFASEHHRSGSGKSFEEWLRQKRRQLNGKNQIKQHVLILSNMKLKEI